MQNYKFFMKSKMSDFFDLTMEEQEKIKIKNSNWEEEYEHFLYKSIANIEDKDIDVLNNSYLEPLVEYEYNKSKSYYSGVGADIFELRTGMPKNERFYNHKSLAQINKSYNTERCNSMKIAYNGAIPAFFSSDRVSFMDAEASYIRKDKNGKDKLIYLYLSDMTSNITESLTEYSKRKIHKIIPHEYVYAEDFGEEKEINGEKYYKVTFDLRANGKEHLVSTLNEKIDLYLQKREAYILTKMNDHKPCIWIKEFDYPQGIERHCYFPNLASLNVDIRNWSKDVEKLELEDFTLINEILDNERDMTDAFIKTEYAELLKTLNNPDDNNEVIKLKTKKIVMMNEMAFNELLEVIAESEDLEDEFLENELNNIEQDNDEDEDEDNDEDDKKVKGLNLKFIKGD